MMKDDEEKMKCHTIVGEQLGSPATTNAALGNVFLAFCAIWKEM